MNKKTLVPCCAGGLLLGLVLWACDSSGDLFKFECRDFAAVGTIPSLWSQLKPAGAGPAARKLHAAAYDVAGDRLIVHGGLGNADLILGDTWILSGASGAGDPPVWQELVPKTGGAPVLHSAFAAYNAQKDTFILLGGVGVGDLASLDLWLLAPTRSSEAKWTRLTPAGNAPALRTDMAAAYDEATDSIYLSGGRAATLTDEFTLLNDTWRLENVTGSPAWVELVATGEKPAPRGGAAAVFDSGLGKLIMIGGYTGKLGGDWWSEPLSGETWVFEKTAGTNGAADAWTWTLIEQVGGFWPVAFHSMVLDPTRHRPVVFSGKVPHDPPHSETFVLTRLVPDGSDVTFPIWSTINAGLPQPPGRMSHVAAFSPGSRSRMIVFGGVTAEDTLLNDVWVLRNASGFIATEIAKVNMLVASTYICVGYSAVVVAQPVDQDGEALDGIEYQWNASHSDLLSGDTLPDGTRKVTGKKKGKTELHAFPVPGGPFGTVEFTIIDPTPTPPAGGRCKNNLSCKGYCNLPSMADDSPGADSGGGFCISGQCYCCLAECDVDPSSGASDNCECFTCSSSDDCYGSELTCDTGNGVCVFE